MKRLSNKEILKNLLEKIQEIKRINIGQISILAGYVSENYLSERMSRGEISDKCIKAVNSVYEKAKNNPAYLDDVGIVIKNAAGESFAAMIRIEAKLNVLLHCDAEQKSFKSGRPLITELKVLDEAVLKEALGLREEYKHNP